MTFDDVPLVDRRSAPAALRNREPILGVLKSVLPELGAVLEVGSGTGEHAAWFAPRLPHLVWQPTEANPDMHANISAWTADSGANNILPPQDLDVQNEIWPPAENLDDLIAVYASCVVHIAPWDVTEGLFRGAEKYLPSGGLLILYGPFAIDGEHTAPSNAQFDMSLRSRDPSWGVRDLNDVTLLGESHEFERKAIIEMPANNLSLVFRRI
jgi:SAM-dependent methyltransferase